MTVRFLVELPRATGPSFDQALTMATVRFPEIFVEHRFAPRDDLHHEVWICRAPSEAHIERWAVALGLDGWSVHQVDASGWPVRDDRR